MATSGSYDFTLNRDQIVTRALQLLQVLPGGTSATGDQLTDAVTQLNLILKAFQNEGMNLWAIQKKTFDNGDGLTAGVYSYTIGTSGTIATSGRPEDIVDMYYQDATTLAKVPMIKLTRQEYYALPDEDQSGTPTQYYFDKLLSPKIYVWPAPDTNFQDNYQFVILYQQAFDDMDSATDTLAFPQSWELSIVWQLASQLSTEYGLPIQERQWITSQAEKYKAIAMSWDTEHESVYFQPNPVKTGYRIGR